VSRTSRESSRQRRGVDDKDDGYANIWQAAGADRGDEFRCRVSTNPYLSKPVVIGPFDGYHTIFGVSHIYTEN
jgi:hypothetical protein